jgi:hypothetical protein
MIKFYPAIKTPDLYSSELINEIYIDLGLGAEEQKTDLKEYMEHSAADYIRRSEEESHSLTRKQEDKKINQIANHLRKSIKLFKEIPDAKPSRVRFPLSQREKDELEQADVPVPERNWGTYPLGKYKESIAYIEEMLREMTEENVNRFSNSTKTTLVLQWLWYFSDFWDEHSSVTLSEGRFNADKYESSAISILTKMIGPINEQISDVNCRITNSLLAEAIVAYRGNKKTEAPFDPEEYFQG